jgi:uncharacterized membrane protein
MEKGFIKNKAPAFAINQNKQLLHPFQIIIATLLFFTKYMFIYNI